MRQFPMFPLFYEGATCYDVVIMVNCLCIWINCEICFVNNGKLYHIFSGLFFLQKCGVPVDVCKARLQLLERE